MKCPMKKYEPGDVLVFKNIPCDQISSESIKNVGAIKLKTPTDEAPSVEIISGTCDEELCAWWCQDTGQCAVLTLAETYRKAVRK